MKHHEIKLEDLQKWLLEEETTFASSTRENKRLVCCLNGNLKVIVGGVTIWQGKQPYSAIEAYNGVTEKWINPLKDFRI